MQRFLKNVSPSQDSCQPWMPANASLPYEKANHSRNRLGIGTQSRSILKCKELPPARDTFELVLTAFLESDVRSGDEILHGGRDQHLTRIGIGLNARCNMDSDSGEIVAPYLDLACVHTGSDLEVEALHRLPDGRSAANWPRASGGRTPER